MRTWAESAERAALRVFAVAVIVAPSAACGDSTAATVSNSTPNATTPTSTSPVTTASTTTSTPTSAPADCAAADLEGADALRFVELLPIVDSDADEAMSTEAWAALNQEWRDAASRVLDGTCETSLLTNCAALGVECRVGPGTDDERFDRLEVAITSGVVRVVWY
ncbi:hypothetical protein BDK89_1742 [Ilumatobacter fluminis]|uniref:Uncharacterized protein n=1 Tax=Ilumatobacter fluminis TaxID=467091 RepID=A0A4R7HZB4_9ACTN|nr:hypothetical protein [Ilumatobacter fluminis]TDT16160.1 hypothetical protein BDK89_1742 [Ilumatobacter fluminis]